MQSRNSKAATAAAEVCLVDWAVLYLLAALAYKLPNAPCSSSSAHLNVSSTASRCPGALPRSTATLSTTPNSWQLNTSCRCCVEAVLQCRENSSNWVLRTTTRSGSGLLSAPPPTDAALGRHLVSHAALQCVTAVGG
jgi:hypothetical protein